MVRREMGSLTDFDFRVETLTRGFARLRLRYDETQLRPGGTIAGPVMFTLADTALYAMVMSAVGWEPLAVTTDMHLHFLRRPSPADLIAEADALTVGRRLVVGEVRLYSDGAERRLVAHATGTYARPSSPPADAGPQRER